MEIRHLILRNFRNYREAHVHFSPLINVIQGDNGQGKSNLLEAIYFLSTGRSFRTHDLSDLIHFGQSYFYIEAHFIKDDVEQYIKIYYDDKTRKVQHNHTFYTTFTSLLGILPSVLLSPDDLSLVSGSPAERRRFLDITIAQTDPLYLHHLGRYYKAMKQRNYLLKNHSDTALFAWEQMMAQSASYIVTKRKEVIHALHSPSSSWMNHLSDQKDSLKIKYSSSIPFDENHPDLPLLFANAWKKSRPKEMQMGTTLLGPHRDDLLIFLSEKEAKTFSSEGQKRSTISSLRFAEWERMRESIALPPLLGIDDFAIQLDSHRQSQLEHHLSRFSQVFLTSPKILSFPLAKEGYSIHLVENGHLYQNIEN
jgi:DNA replication and repair protein RecF